MIKRKLLGQHFLNSKSIAEFIVDESHISNTDVVFEIGTGLGILTPLLCKKAQKVISIDADERIIERLNLNSLHFIILCWSPVMVLRKNILLQFLSPTFLILEVKMLLSGWHRTLFLMG